MIGASVRVVTRSVVLPRSRVARRRRRVTPGLYGVKHQQPVERARPSPAGSGWPSRRIPGWLARFENDRDLTAIKAALIGVAALIAMALEVPW